MGPKLLLVCALAVLMTIPAMFVFLLIYDRTSRAETVTQEIGGLVGGRQTFVGPILAVPYTTPPPPAQPVSPGQPAPAQPQPVSGTYLIYPTQADVAVSTRSEVRTRSLFQVPVYKAKLDFVSRFDLAGAPNAAPANAQFDWGRAEWVVGVSDPRGAQADIVLHVGDAALPLAPATVMADILISAYAGWTFESRREGLRALAVFSLLYAMIYGLMRLEDLALLVGAVASFAAIAAVMYFTRKLDWYGVTSPTPPTRSAPVTLQG